jgi:redox-sensitive bicupin YhaK (pirin superfamily)
MIQVRKSKDRGHANHGWLDSYHTFSFADYYDPDFMGFRVLRVINEDRIAGGQGFPTHPHKDMEIITYVTEGALEHRDSLGSHGVIRPGDVQQMSAGTGIRHSEFNHEQDKPTRLLQIWILPDRPGHESRYGQINFSKQLASSDLVLVASGTGEDGSVPVHQDMKLFVAQWKAPCSIHYNFRPGRYGWIQVVDGNVDIGGVALATGDGAAIANESEVLIQSTDGRLEFLLFDLP